VNYKVYIQKQMWSNALGIAIFEERDGKQFMAKPIELVFEEIDRYGEVVKPTLQIGYQMAEPFLKAMAESLDEFGVKTDSDAKLAGTMQATRAHLEDMRSLVFKQKPKC